MIPVTAAPGPPRPSSLSLPTLDFFLLKSRALPAGLVHYQGIICFHNLHFFLSISQGLAGDAASLWVLFVDGECPLQENTPSQEKPLEIQGNRSKELLLDYDFYSFHSYTHHQHCWSLSWTSSSNSIPPSPTATSQPIPFGTRSKKGFPCSGNVFWQGLKSLSHYFRAQTFLLLLQQSCAGRIFY